MKLRRAGFWVGLLALGVGAAWAGVRSPGEMVVHEWGTFLVMQGSDGATLDGMYHEEHALPAFVHARSRDQLKLPSVLVKGETPVIYFYTDRAQSAHVEVGFPKGIWTQWYPQAHLVGPYLDVTAAAQPRDGHISWQAEVIPAREGQPVPALPPVAKGALWNYAREVDAAYVRTVDRTRGATASEYERFLFYRGLGQAPLPLTMTPSGGGTLSMTQAGPGARHLFVLRVEKGKGSFRYLPEIKPGETLRSVIPTMSDARPVSEFTDRVADALAERLVESGLYPKEARAMVNTWKTSYFQSDGIRALFVLPQAWTDEFIPMQISPVPKQTVRVMVGRLEMLTGEREQQAENAVRELASPEAARREKAFDFLRDQGRYVEPIVRRVQRTTADPGVRNLCARLLVTDFVTELRAAVHSAKNGARVRADGLYLRAQLASLLREMGETEPARAEAAAVLARLRQQPAPPLTESGSRHYYRSLARATEGAGDARATMEAYAQLVRFGAGVKKCGGCHETEGPRNMAWFRDWWAGRKLAEYAAQAKQTERLIGECEAELARKPEDTASQMTLAYLYEGKGEKRKAEQMWVKVVPAGKERQARAAGE